MKIHELRRNPELNQKEDIISIAETYKGQNVHVHFGQELKLGLNPRYKNNHTFLGIYAYPVDYFLQERKKYLLFSNRKYVWFLRESPNAKILNIKTYSNNDLEKDLRKLRQGNWHSPIGTHQHPYLHLKTTIDLMIKDTIPFVRTINNPQAIAKNHVYRKLGYDIIIDYDALVSADIDVETVFLHSKAFIPLQMAINSVPNRETRIRNHY